MTTAAPNKIRVTFDVLAADGTVLAHAAHYEDYARLRSLHEKPLASRWTRVTGMARSLLALCTRCTEDLLNGVEQRGGV